MSFSAANFTCLMSSAPIILHMKREFITYQIQLPMITFSWLRWIHVFVECDGVICMYEVNKLDTAHILLSVKNRLH